jgi:flagellar biosynthesis/type III secretory pathway M-ring protein FliF/YscJ
MSFLPILLAQIKEVIEGVDHAANSSDRWLFLASLVVIIIIFSAVIRFLVQQLTQAQLDSKQLMESMSKQHKEEISELQKVHNTFMATLYTENVKLTAQVLVALQDNNGLLKRLQDLVAEVMRERSSLGEIFNIIQSNHSLLEQIVKQRSP